MSSRVGIAEEIIAAPDTFAPDTFAIIGAEVARPFTVFRPVFFI